MSLIQPVIKLEQKKKTAQEIRATLPLPLKILTSPLTTLGLASVLTAVISPATALAGASYIGKALIPTSVKGVIATTIAVPTGIAILSSSKKARDVSYSLINPMENIERGKAIGSFLEKDPKGADIIGIVEKTAVVGLGAGLIAGAIAIGKNYLGDKDELPEAPATPITPATLPQAPAITSLPTQNIPKSPSNVYPQDAVNQAGGVPFPIQPVTTPTGEKAVSRRKRGKNKPQQALRQTISQRVNVMVTQKNISNKLSKKYINEVLVAR